MTIQKAMDYIEEILHSAVRDDNSIAYELDTNDCNWIEMAKSALEKQIPKKLIIDKRNIYYVIYKDYLCPCCKKQIIQKTGGDIIAGKRSYYCDNCGQALDWSSEVEDEMEDDE